MDIKALFTPFPILPTPRLILRALHPSDLNDLYEYASDPQIDQYVPWKHYKNIEEAHENLNEFLEEYEKEVAALRHGMDAATFEECWEKGRSLTMDQAIELAIQ